MTRIQSWCTTTTILYSLAWCAMHACKVLHDGILGVYAFENVCMYVRIHNTNYILSTQRGGKNTNITDPTIWENYEICSVLRNFTDERVLKAEIIKSGPTYTEAILQQIPTHFIWLLLVTLRVSILTHTWAVRASS